MNVGKILGKLVLVVGVWVFLFSPLFSATSDLGIESEEYARETASQKITPDELIAKVNKAAAFLEKEGKGALPRFRGRGSEFIFAGTYMSIHRIDGLIVLHPLKPRMEGLMMLNLKDATGKLFYVEMNNVVKTRGSGWVSYMWPKPGTNEAIRKITYVKLVRVKGEEWVLKCGLYTSNEAEIRKLLE